MDVLIECGGTKASRRYAPLAAGYRDDDFGQEVATAQHQSRAMVIKAVVVWVVGIVLCGLVCFGLLMLAALVLERRKARRLRGQQQALV
jgi:cobalamin synthase